VTDLVLLSFVAPLYHRCTAVNNDRMGFDFVSRWWVMFHGVDVAVQLEDSLASAMSLTVKGGFAAVIYGGGGGGHCGCGEVWWWCCCGGHGGW
jgi:hypothetical protein